MAFGRRGACPGQIKSAEAKEEYEREGQRLEQEYQDGMDQLEEELWQQQDADVEAARQNLESAKIPGTGSLGRLRERWRI